MKPTVSVNSTALPPGISTRRVVGSSVANSLSSASTPAFVIVLSSVDLPAGSTVQGRQRGRAGRASAVRGRSRRAGWLLQVSSCAARCRQTPCQQNSRQALWQRQRQCKQHPPALVYPTRATTGMGACARRSRYARRCVHTCSSGRWGAGNGREWQGRGSECELAPAAGEHLGLRSSASIKPAGQTRASQPAPGVKPPAQGQHPPRPGHAAAAPCAP